MSRELHLRVSELQFVEFRTLMEEWLERNPLRSD